MPDNPAKFLIKLFDNAVSACSAHQCLPPHLATIEGEKFHVIGAGKAAAAMASVVEEHCHGKLSGVVVTRYGHSAECDRIKVIEASHPLPDEQGLSAAQEIKSSLSNLDADTVVVGLISGGASALLTLPHQKVSFSEKKLITQQLLLSGANIHEINTVRKHLSAIKGGRLMQSIHPARSYTFCVSDVVGDDPSTIGSGPTVPDSTTCSDVLKIFDQCNIQVTDNIVELLKLGELETPKPFDPIFEDSVTKVIARPIDGLEASADKARSAGWEPIVLGDSITGDCNEAAKFHADYVRQKLLASPKRKKFVVLSGGETTVTVTGNGKGGPNTQFALVLAIELQQEASVFAIACDTDGIDGTETNAGAVIDPTTLSRAKNAGLDPHEYLSDNNSFEFFKQLGDLVETGPTLTNINDFRAILVDAN